MSTIPPANELGLPATALAGPLRPAAQVAASPLGHRAMAARQTLYDEAAKETLAPVQPGTMAAFARFFPAASIQDRVMRDTCEPPPSAATERNQPFDSYFKKVSQALMLERRRRGIPPPINKAKWSDLTAKS